MSEVIADTLTLYGIANCDTIRKARRWLAQRDVEYRFHDYRKQGIDAALLRAFDHAIGWQAMLNRRGRGWRELPAATREAIDRDAALAAMLANPAMIRRPIAVHRGGVEVGFDAARYAQLFG